MNGCRLSLVNPWGQLEYNLWILPRNRRVRFRIDLNPINLERANRPLTLWPAHPSTRIPPIESALNSSQCKFFLRLLTRRRRRPTSSAPRHPKLNPSPWL